MLPAKLRKTSYLCRAKNHLFIYYQPKNKQHYERTQTHGLRSLRNFPRFEL